MNASQLIERSASHTEIVHTAWTKDLEAELREASEDSVKTERGIEIWGTTPGGDEWRVHLDMPCVDDDLCDRWLGRDWPDITSPAEAMRLATACQAKRDEGDSRDYTAILAEVVG